MRVWDSLLPFHMNGGILTLLLIANRRDEDNVHQISWRLDLHRFVIPIRDSDAGLGMGTRDSRSAMRD